MNRIVNRKIAGYTGWLGVAALVLGVVCLVPAVRADNPAQGGRAARLSFVDGHVRITQGGQVLSEQANINTPLFEGMQITTVDDGKAEIELDDGSVVRLSPDTTLTLTVLRGQDGGGDAEMTLNGGLAYFELQGGNQSGQMGVHFADSVATVSGFTVLRVQMDTPPGALAVFSGNAHLEGGNGAMSMDLHGGESVALLADDISHSVVAESIEPDSWDAWNSDRDQALTAESATQTSAAGDVGGNQSQNPAWSDLDANGNWYNVPGQGYVWSPYDAANPGWDPYGFGDWMWMPGYGYIWTSGYSWGYLPYQCGLWNFYDGFGWGWAPGSYGCQPWWGVGYYGGPFFGGYLPRSYRIPKRPILPRQPVGGHPIPIIPVNRPLKSGIPGGFPLRSRSTSVTIGGNLVEPLRALPMRPDIQKPAADYANREATVYQHAPAAPAANANNNVRSAYGPGRGTYVAPATGSHSPSGGSYSAPRSSPSGGGAPSHSSSGGGGGFHGSSGSGGGGGGGGGFHGGGGGGGGGGGSHGGGGGGGGGGHH